jgi:hypothetical protein
LNGPSFSCEPLPELQLHEHLRETQPQNEVRKIARVRTLTILPYLGSERKRNVVQFLHESHLIVKGKPIVDLSGADLVRANLREANLSEANLERADLSGASLLGADPERANLIEARVTREKLNAAESTDDAIGLNEIIKNIGKSWTSLFSYMAIAISSLYQIRSSDASLYMFRECRTVGAS